MHKFKKRLACSIMIIMLLATALIPALLAGLSVVASNAEMWNSGNLTNDPLTQEPTKNKKLTAITSGSLLYAPKERTEGVFTLVPKCSEGVTLTYDESDMGIMGVSQYGIFTFTESKMIVLTAEFAQGWTYNDDFTVFFPDEPKRVNIEPTLEGGIRFSFEAVKGESVSIAELEDIGIYATAAKLPRLDIDSDIELSDINKEEWIDAEFTLSLGTKQFESGNYTGRGSIKGRGSKSWTQPKKAYSIKLDSKASLLDIPSTKKYAIVASYSDASLMRNYVTYKAGLMLEGIEYTPKCEFVEVYYNGEYHGIYLLAERIAVETNKLDLPQASESDMTGSYLIEKNIYGKFDPSSEPWFNCPYWANQSQDFFVLKAPEISDDEVTQRMLEYLEAYMQGVHGAIMGASGESFDTYVDTSSWVDFIIMQEIAKNIDGNLKTSCYMYKLRDDERLYMTALWDFDLAYGNSSWDNADIIHNDYNDCPTGAGAKDFMTINSSCPWFKSLYEEHPEFRQALIERYAEYRGSLIPAMRAMMSEQAAYLALAAEKNDELWNKDFDKGVNELRNWFDERINWLDSQWLEGCEEIDPAFALNVDGGRLRFDFDFASAQYPPLGVVEGGRLAAMSGNAGADNSESGIGLTLDMKAGETLSFDYRVSSEYGFDTFTFTVDGEQLVLASGDGGWQSYTYTSSDDGIHTFRWAYIKDASASGGCDCVWMDNVEFSGEVPYIPYDVNMDDDVDTDDALMILRGALGILTLDEQQRILAKGHYSNYLDANSIADGSEVSNGSEVADGNVRQDVAVVDALHAMRLAIVPEE
ncbi:MAG: CotH kinase family protein [Christensenellaceae bacterium]|nr:CotH kinase family protein [Christensenellaceae bacterium]